jgi:acetyl esterase/lipase
LNKIFNLAIGLAVAMAIATFTVGCGSNDEKKRSPQPSKRNVVYTPTLQMGGPGYVDIYEPPAPMSSTSKGVTLKNRPAVIVIHGGAWRSGTKYQVSGVASQFAREGFVAFAPDYSLAPRVQWPAPLIDLQTLVRFMRSNADEFGIDPKGIGAWGQSAGGHLATMLALVDDPQVTSTPTSTSSSNGSGGTSSSPPADLKEIVVTSGRVRCAIDASGPADLSIPNGMAPDEDGILRDFLGAPRFQLSPLRIAEASTTTYARKDASVLILHGTADTFVSIDHAEHLFRALSEKEADTDLIRVYGGGHDATTFHAPEAWAATIQFCTKRLELKADLSSSSGLQGPFLKLPSGFGQ